MAKRMGALILVAVVAFGCGDGSDTGDEQSTADPAGATDAVSDESASEAADSSSEAAESSGGGASGTVTVAGETYHFSDVAECEIGGDWGPDWRSFVAWTDDGHVHLSITLASGDDAWLTGFDMSVGLQNPRTLDEGNPDEEWTTGLGGGSVSHTLTDNGASGTADVTTLSVEDGAIDAVAEWSFSC